MVEIEVRKHDEPAFRRELARKLHSALLELSPKSHWTAMFERAAGILKNFTLSASPNGNVSLGLSLGVDAGATHGDDLSLALDVTEVFVAVGEAARDQGKGVLLLLDEVQFLGTTQLEAVIQAIHKTVQRTLPITVVGAGLPQLAELAGDAKSYAERLFKFPSIGNLDDDDTRRALDEPAREEGAHFTADALDLAVQVTGGYPYFIQELGSAVWGLAGGPEITLADVRNAIPAYEAKLDASFFRVRIDRATELQRAYMRAMAELGPGPQKAADVAEMMGRSSTNLAPTRSGLINMGLLYTPEHGYAAFTVPHFDQYLKRTIPELVVPPLRRRGQTPG